MSSLSFFRYSCYVSDMIIISVNSVFYINTNLSSFLHSLFYYSEEDRRVRFILLPFFISTNLQDTIHLFYVFSLTVYNVLLYLQANLYGLHNTHDKMLYCYYNEYDDN